MALLRIEGIHRRILEILRGLSPGEGLEVLSYKRNRGILILREEDSFLVRERGYLEETRRASEPELPRILKSAIRREFPRSRRLRLYRVDRSALAGPERKRL